MTKLKTTFALVAALNLLACAQVPTSPHAKPAARTTASEATGAVKVAFTGLAGYHLKATAADVAVVVLTLRSGAWSDSRKVELASLRPTKPGVDFERVPAGKVTLEALALDAGGEAIGKGSTSGEVVRGKSTALNATVRLVPTDDTGSVNATIAFVETDPPIACKACQ